MIGAGRCCVGAASSKLRFTFPRCGSRNCEIRAFVPGDPLRAQWPDVGFAEQARPFVLAVRVDSKFLMRRWSSVAGLTQQLDLRARHVRWSADCDTRPRVVCTRRRLHPLSTTRNVDIVLLARRRVQLARRSARRAHPPTTGTLTPRVIRRFAHRAGGAPATSGLATSPGPKDP